MAWRRSGDKPLFEPMMVGLPTHICVTRPQWVNTIAFFEVHNLQFNMFNSLIVWWHIMWGECWGNLTVCLIACSGQQQRKYQFFSLAMVDSPHYGPAMQKHLHVMILSWNPQPILINHQWGHEESTWRGFYKKCSRYFYLWYEFENYKFNITATSPRGHWDIFLYVDPCCCREQSWHPRDVIALGDCHHHDVTVLMAVITLHNTLTMLPGYKIIASTGISLL